MDGLDESMRRMFLAARQKYFTQKSPWVKMMAIAQIQRQPFYGDVPQKVIGKTIKWRRLKDYQRTIK